MRGALLSLLALLVLAAPTAAGDPAPVPAADGLVGTWRVDLRPTPDAEAYSQPFVVRAIDGSGDYHTTGVRDGDGLRGTTHSLGREFLAVWTAERVE